MPTDVLEPPEIGALAEALREGAWLDLRVVDFGNCHRVRIESINVHRERDVLVIVQKVPEGDSLREATYAIDAEDIRWMRPTQVALEDVEPITPPDAKGLAAKRIVAEIVRTIAFLTEGVSEADLVAGGKQTGCIRPRQEAMWLAYEMTDLSPLVIATEHFGYASQQPMLTVHQKLTYALQNAQPFHYNEGTWGAWIERVRGAQRLIDSNLGVRARRSDDRPWARVL